MRVHPFALAALLACAPLCAPRVNAATYVNRVPDGSGGYNIVDATLANQTWTTAGSPYIVERNVIVPKAVTLNVQPGVNVQAVNGFGFYIYGTLNATGASGTHITFTSGKGTPSDGDWLGIYLGPFAGASVLQYCDISYAGNYSGGNGFGFFSGGYRMCSVCVDASSPRIANCSISRSQTHGIEVFGTGATIQNNTFANVGATWYDIFYSSPDTFPTISGNSGSGAGSVGVGIPGGNMAVGGHWTIAGANFPYFLTADLGVSAGAALTLDPGVSVQSNGPGMFVNGTINAQGTAGSPISFTSRNATKAPGDWLGIYLGPAAGGSILSQCTLNYAGAYRGGNGFGSFHTQYHYGTLFVDASFPTIANCTISNSATHGLELHSGGAIIQNDVFQSVGAGWYDVYYSIPDTFPVISGNSGSGTGYAGVGVPGGAMSAGGRWPIAGAAFPYFLTADMTIDVPATLTIDPGVSVQSGGPGIFVGGKMLAQGTASLPITFTTRNTTKAPGDWLGICIKPTGGASILSQCAFSYGGAYRGGNGFGSAHSTYHFGTLFVDTSSPTIANCAISNSATHGLEVYGGGASIQSNSFSNISTNWYDVFYSTPDTFPVIGGNSGSGTGFWGVGVAGGTMTVGGRWVIAGTAFPYFLTADLAIGTAATITIDPGVSVQSNGPGMYVNGKILAQGTAGSPVTFTSRNATPAAGDWLGVYLGPTAGASILDRCVFSYGGNYRGGNGFGSYHSLYPLATIFVDTSAPTITNCSISYSQTNGLEEYGGGATIRGNTFANVGGTSYDVYYSVPDTFPTISENSGSGTGYPGVGVAGGTMAVGGSWPIAGAAFPYFLTNDLTVKAGATLTVNPGVTVQSGGPGIYVNGVLSAQGTAPLPITFTSRYATKSPGDWLGVYLGPTAGGSVLSNCKLSYGGNYRGGNGYGNYHSHYPMATIYVDSSSPTIANCAISNSSTHGIEVYSGTAAIQGNVFQNVGTAYYDVYYSIPDTFPAISGNTGSGTGTAGVGIPGGSMAVGGRWVIAGTSFPYFLTADLAIGSAATISIDPGVTVQSGGPGIWVNGTMLAQGTAGAPITFTSRNATPVAGDWMGVYLAPTAGASVLDRCTFNYGGNYRGGGGFGRYHDIYHFATLFVDSSSPSITNCTISNSSTHGLDIYANGATIRDNVFSNVGSGAYDVFYSLVESSPLISGNTGSGTGSVGVGIGAGTTVASGRWRIAGPNFPYFLTTDIGVGAGTTLTVDPGVTVKSGGPGIWVYGTLSARGLPFSPITFTSRNATPASGDWLGIYFGPAAGGSSLTQCTLNYGGNYRGGSGFGSYHSTYLIAVLAIDSCAPVFDGITITNSQTNGVAAYASAITLRNSVVRAAGDGIVSYANSPMQLRNDTISGNGVAGLHTIDSSPSVANCIMAYNARGVFNEGTGAPAIRSSDVGFNTTADYFGLADQTGTNGNIKQNPFFVNLAAGDLHLGAGSPCINTGDDSYTFAGETDRDGGARIWGAHVDMGAYELRSVPPVKYTLTDVANALRAAGGLLAIDLPGLQRLNLESGGTTANPINLLDALRIARKVAGVDSNP